ncbi:uncharacterized protein BJ171DRAFT_438706 [Polychytrium aggregatum]|uniref:uncharacterized protein n=1 Tax=Polychytrium aggregatum TaxID=110093 RepID=UPI0022FDDA36|nr:uncharacterized protein BJ171DRAFT_438706 [Polychytrium aggregatum]KAI9208371.1 hypothetical protein BJ171DRAFT_438706 [Polychytrium aggregatum]
MAGLCHPDGQMRIGLTPSETIALSLHCENQYTGSQSWLAALADQGNASASYILARVLQVKLFGPSSTNKPKMRGIARRIMRYLRKAADAGHPKAKFYLAGCYHDGIVTNRDHTKAVELYCNVADRGMAQAQVALGRCYELGEGVDQDINAAIEWYSKAEDQGSEDGRLHIHLTAVCLVNGFGTTEDRVKAAGIFEQLANDSHSDSQLWIGECYRRGGGVSEDHEKAFEWYNKAASQGNSYGHWMVGTCYYFGQGVAHDETKALEWFRRSADQDNRYGQYHLGNCYRDGYGVDADINTAVLWYRKSANQGCDLAIDRLKWFGKWP